MPNKMSNFLIFQIDTLVLTLLDVLVDAVVLRNRLDVGEAALVDVAEEQLVRGDVLWHEHVLRVQSRVVSGVDATCSVSVVPIADAVELGQSEPEEGQKSCKNGAVKQVSEMWSNFPSPK